MPASSQAWQRHQAELAAAAAAPTGPAIGAEGQPPGPTLEEQQRQQLLELLEWEPAGHKYVYNEETGMLQTTGENEMRMCFPSFIHLRCC